MPSRSQKSLTAKTRLATKARIKARPASTAGAAKTKAQIKPRPTSTAGTTKAQLLETIRNLEYQLENATRCDQARRAPFPARHGYPWSLHDEQFLVNYFKNGGIDLFEAAKALLRTPYAVFLRAFKLGLTDENNVYTLWKTAAKHIPAGSAEERNDEEHRRALGAYLAAKEQEFRAREISRFVTPGKHFY